MKKLNFLLVSITMLLISNNAFAQSKASDSEMSRLMLTAWVPEQIEGMPSSANNMLTNKLKEVITKNGISASPFNSRFVISANITVSSKDILPGPPTMHSYTLDVTLYIGDGFEGTAFSSKTITVKGVGVNETKAYMAGIKMIKPAHPEVQAFIKEGKTKIIDYYNNNCDLIIKKAKNLEAQNQFEEAIFLLSSVPDACDECFEKSMKAVEPIYLKKIERDCKLKLQEAQTIWNAAQDIEAAEKAGAILSTIEPQTSCFTQVKALMSKIEARVKEIDAREWKYILKDQEQKSEMIQAVRDIGVAYGNGQPDTVIYKSLW